MSDVILVLNAGSSTLKYSAFLVDGLSLLLRGQIETREADQATYDAAVDRVLNRCRDELGSHRVVAIGHRVVHGGMRYSTPVRVDDAVLVELEALVPLAPLHQPHNLRAIRTLLLRSPQLPQVACFDTAFHRTQPEVAQRFGLPRQLTEQGIRRYGFHGLSYEYIASVLPGIDPTAAAGRTVVAHLGHGASLCALLHGQSVATTMSFTPADGLLMGTRCGSLDPGVLLYLLRQRGMTAQEVEYLINHESGLLGVSGFSSDMRELLASSDLRAREAVDLFVYRINRELGSMAASLGGLDAMVFTGGIGENAEVIRNRIVQNAAWIGPFRVHVVPTHEELIIAKHTQELLNLN